MADRSFWGMVTTQFLGAFNDNLYKQLMLLLAVPVAVVAADAAADGAGQGATSDAQGWATLVFSLPFVLFSGFAGYLSDRFSKTPIIVYCKVAEIAVMLLGLAAFYCFEIFGTAGTWIVLFLMGTQSSFFGPGKYGILPELFRSEDLPKANGLILMTTFLAIIFGTVLAGVLKAVLFTDGSASSLALGMLLCVVIAVAGTLTSLLVRRVAAAQPGMPFVTDSLGICHDARRLLRADPGLMAALLVGSVFWLVSGIAVPTVNRLGFWLGANATWTSVLTASIGLGIMIGALLAAYLCRKGIGDRCVSLGLVGICVSLAALGTWLGNQHLLGYTGSLIALVLLGVNAAVFAIPLQVFIQDRPPAVLKGRMIATMNQANFTGILISGPLYQLFEWLSRVAGWPISSVFWMMGCLVLPLAALYRLDSSVPKPHLFEQKDKVGSRD
jgi:acyl-[acyl-carrier-protein]-phospholipid O-acyltransferase/long-chain-fatty-acid--[acyl-carrier-protein] ligase